MTGQASAQATARSPLEFVACSSCHAPHAPTLPLFLTDCAHTLCQTCTANATAQGEGAAAGPEAITCLACGHAGPVVRLDLASSLEHCFRPLQDLISELGMAAEWQLVNLVDQLAYFRQKCAEQKQMLAKAATELRKMGDLRDRVAELSRQNETLQRQLTAATPQPFAPPPSRSLAQFAAANDQNVPPVYGQQPPPPATQSRGQKRPRGNSPERNAFFELPSASLSPSVSSASLALAPGRLSLTPAQQKQTAARLSAQSSMQNRGPPPPASSSSISMSANGRASRQGGPAPRNAADESSKDRLARFAYNPSRASIRSAAGTPALPPPPPPAQEHLAPPARASTAQGESPFYYNVPSAPSAPQHETQQQHRYDYLPNDSFTAVDDDGGFGGGREPPYADHQDDRQLMPPPPLPSTRRHPQKHVVASNASYNTPATHLGGGTAQPQQHFAGTQQTSATRGPGMISRPASSSLPPRASSTSTMTSHRQPFRPASVAARPPSGQQSSARYGAGVRGGGGY